MLFRCIAQNLFFRRIGDALKWRSGDTSSAARLLPAALAKGEDKMFAKTRLAAGAVLFGLLALTAATPSFARSQAHPADVSATGGYDDHDDDGSIWSYYRTNPGATAFGAAPHQARSRTAAKAPAQTPAVGPYIYEHDDNGTTWSYYPGYVDDISPQAR
jgi:hypothetical protein